MFPFLESVWLMDEALKKHKGDLVSFMIYPGEFHYFTREHVLLDAWHRVDDFFDFTCANLASRLLARQAIRRINGSAQESISARANSEVPPHITHSRMDTRFRESIQTAQSACLISQASPEFFRRG